MDRAAICGLDHEAVFSGIEVLPHGLDLSIFGPRHGGLEDFEQRRLEARRTLYPERPDLWRGFWVLNANRNQPRKRLDLTLAGFAVFAAEAPPDVRLTLRWGGGSCGLGVDVQRMAHGLGIAGRLVPPLGPGPLSSERLNLLYNAADVGVNTATGEGWGLTSFEHAATGAAQVLPAHTAGAEHWEGAAELLPVRRTRGLGGRLSAAEIAPDDLGAALHRLYGDRAHYARLCRRAAERARDPGLRWDTIAASWDRWLTWRGR